MGTLAGPCPEGRQKHLLRELGPSPGTSFDGLSTPGEVVRTGPPLTKEGSRSEA